MAVLTLYGDGDFVLVDAGSEAEAKWREKGYVDGSEEVAADDKSALQARLDELGIEYDARWGVAKLRKALEAAE